MNEIDNNIMMSFLKLNYPVVRVKENFRFKRAMILDNGSTYFLSDEHSNIYLKNELIKVLKTVFYCDELSSRTVLKKFLNI